jgi:hypothetical protein
MGRGRGCEADVVGGFGRGGFYSEKGEGGDALMCGCAHDEVEGAEK